MSRKKLNGNGTAILSLPDPKKAVRSFKDLLEGPSGDDRERLVKITIHSSNGNSHSYVAFKGKEKGAYLTMSGDIITIERLK